MSRRVLQHTSQGPAGRWWALPELPEEDVWLNSEQVSILTCRPEHTISSWLCRGGPASAPFPDPDLVIEVLDRLAAWPLGGDTAKLRCPVV